MNNKLPTAQLWIAPHNTIEQQIISYLRYHLCNNHTDTNCLTCTQLTNRQHHQLLWLDPEKPYTLEDLAPLFETIAFARDEHSPFFFIISHAEWLNKSCANQLLKILEEPPVDYYFIICTSNAHAVLPTIRSRCIVVNYHATPELMHHPLCTFFIQTIQPDPLALLHLLDTSTPSENESAELIDLLLNHYYQENLKKTTASNQEKIKLLQHMLMQPPMPGSSKNIWRNLLIHWPTR